MHCLTLCMECQLQTLRGLLVVSGFSTGRSTVTCQALMAPESHPGVLINWATQDVHNSLLNIVCAGEKRLQRFVHGTLESGESCSFYSHIKKSGMKTFADIAKHTKFKCDKGGVVAAAISPEIVFRRVLSLARCRYDVSMATVLCHFSC